MSSVVNDMEPRGLMGLLEDEGWYQPVERWPVMWWRKVCGWIADRLNMASSWFTDRAFTPWRNDNPPELPRIGKRS